MNHDAHTLREFDAALTSLNTHLLQMAYKAQNALDLAVSGLLQQDEDSANQAIADDEELDELEMAMDREGLHLLAFFSPVASDLRLVLASIRLSAIYERMGDESVTIAKRANKLNKRPRLQEAGLVEPVYRELAEQFRAVNKAVSSWDAPVLASLAPGTGVPGGENRDLDGNIRPSAGTLPGQSFIRGGFDIHWPFAGTHRGRIAESGCGSSLRSRASAALNGGAAGVRTNACLFRDFCIRHGT